MDDEAVCTVSGKVCPLGIEDRCSVSQGVCPFDDQFQELIMKRAQLLGIAPKDYMTELVKQDLLGPGGLTIDSLTINGDIINHYKKEE